MTIGKVFRADKTYPLRSLSLPSETLSNLNENDCTITAFLGGFDAFQMIKTAR